MLIGPWVGSLPIVVVTGLAVWFPVLLSEVVGGEGPGTEVVRGDDAIVKNRDDVWLGGEQAESRCVVLLAGRLDDGDSEVIIALGKVNACRADAGLRIAGNGGVAVEDEVAVGDEAGGVDLGDGDGGEQKRKKGGVFQATVAEPAGVSLRHRDGRFTAKEHGGTSLLH